MFSKNNPINIAKPVFDPALIKKVVAVLKSGQVAQGKVVAQLEKAAGKIVKAKFCVAVSSGTAGLHTALAVLDLKPGDEVITTPFTFIATINCIIAAGARPVLVDIDKKTFNLNPRLISKVLTLKTKVILPVSLFGLPYDYDSVRKAIGGGSIKIVEDACQSFGSEYRGMSSGTLGDIGVTSLYATKIVTAGEGGLIFTDDENLAEKMRRFRHHGQVGAYDYLSFGLNYRMTDVLAAMALAQIKKLDFYISKRKANGVLYNRLLGGLPGITLPWSGVSYLQPNFSLYTIRVDQKLNRDGLLEYLKNSGVNAVVYYPTPLHLTKFLSSELNYHLGDFPEAEKASREVLSLPNHPGVSPSDIKFVSNLIKKYVQENN